jgi:hypothetical protein
MNATTVFLILKRSTFHSFTILTLLETIVHIRAIPTVNARPRSVDCFRSNAAQWIFNAAIRRKGLEYVESVVTQCRLCRTSANGVSTTVDNYIPI